MLFYRVNQRSRLYTDIYKISHISISSHHQSTLNSLLSSHTLSTTYQQCAQQTSVSTTVENILKAHPIAERQYGIR